MIGMENAPIAKWSRSPQKWCLDFIQLLFYISDQTWSFHWYPKNFSLFSRNISPRYDHTPTWNITGTNFNPQRNSLKRAKINIIDRIILHLFTFNFVQFSVYCVVSIAFGHLKTCTGLLITKGRPTILAKSRIKWTPNSWLHDTSTSLLFKRLSDVGYGNSFECPNKPTILSNSHKDFKL